MRIPPPFLLLIIGLAGCNSPNETALKRYLEEGEGRKLIEKIIDEKWDADGLEKVEGVLKEIILKRSDPAERPVEDLLKSRIKVEAGNAPSKGSKTAPITIVEFVDYLDPNCQKGMVQMEHLLYEYPDQILWAVRQNPLNIYKGSDESSLAALAAHEQSKFWNWHAIAMGSQFSQKEENFQKWAKNLGMDVAKFNQDRKSAGLREQLKRDKQLAKDLEAAVPSYFINGVHILGAQPLSVFKEVIDRLLKERNIDPEKVKRQSKK